MKRAVAPAVSTVPDEFFPALLLSPRAAKERPVQ